MILKVRTTKDCHWSVTEYYADPNRSVTESFWDVITMDWSSLVVIYAYTVFLMLSGFDSAGPEGLVQVCDRVHLRYDHHGPRVLVLLSTHKLKFFL